MDNIAIGLWKEGVRAVRVGRPDKINRILEEITHLARSEPFQHNSGPSLAMHFSWQVGVLARQREGGNEEQAGL